MVPGLLFNKCAQTFRCKISVTQVGKLSEKCHNHLAAAAHRPRMDGPNRTACRPPVSIREESLLATPNSPLSLKLWNNPQSLDSLSRRQIHLCLRHEASGHQLCQSQRRPAAVVVLSLKKRGGNIFRVTTSDCQRVQRVNTFFCALTE